MEVTNRFKGLDLIDRAPEELRTEVCNTVQDVVIKIIPQKKKRKIVKWLSKETLQIAVKRRKVKNKGEKESYTHLNADGFTEEQAVPQTHRDKKTFLSDQYKK